MSERQNEDREQDGDASSSESNTGFSTGTSASEDDGVASATSGHSDDAVRSERQPQVDEPPPDENRPSGEGSSSADHSVVRGEFSVDDEEEDNDENDALLNSILYSLDEEAPQSLAIDDEVGIVAPALVTADPNQKGANDDMPYATPPRDSLQSSPIADLSAIISDGVEEEHEIVFEATEPADLQQLFESAATDNNATGGDADASPIQAIPATSTSAQRNGSEGNVPDSSTADATPGKDDSRSGFLFGMFPRRVTKRRSGDGGDRSDLAAATTSAFEPDTLVVPSGSPLDSPRRRRRRQHSKLTWFPFRARPSHSTHPNNHHQQSTDGEDHHDDSTERIENFSRPLASTPAMPTDQPIVSPAKTEPMSDAAQSPDRQSPSRSDSVAKQTNKDETKEKNGSEELTTLLPSGDSAKKATMPKSSSSDHRNDPAREGDDDDSTTFGIAVSVQTLFAVGVVLVLVAIVSTIGTSYLGAQLALRGNTLMVDIVSPESVPNETLAVAASPSTGPNSTNPATDRPPVSSTSECEREQLLLRFEIQFDSQPVEVGFSLRDSGTFGGASLWAFDAFSFRSFTQFLRRNVFSICLAMEPTYEFEITDAFANGLVSRFGTSTLVYGQWSLIYNSTVLASYHGDCDASVSRSTSREDAAAGAPTISLCGSYCSCSFRFSSNATEGQCLTNCSRSR